VTGSAVRWASSSVSPAEVFGLLDALVDRSLVLAEEQREGLRYRMLETVREYALERLRESEEEQIVRARHAGYYLALAEQAQPFLEKPEPEWLDRLEVEHDNLRAALTCFGGREERVEEMKRLVSALCPFWHNHAHFHEARTWLIPPALRPSAPTKARAELLGWAVRQFIWDGDSATARRLATERLAIYRQLGDRPGVASALTGLVWLEGDPLAARALAEESLSIVRELDDRHGIAQSLYLLGHLAREAGNHEEARAHWRECQSLDEEVGVKGGRVLFALGELALQSGDYAPARRFITRFVAERREIGDRWNVAQGVLHLGALAQSEGEVERAARLIGASFALRDSLALQLSSEERAIYERMRSALREALDEPAVAAAWEAGRAMTYTQAVEYALRETSEQAYREECCASEAGGSAGTL
jgi:tetratricopeptide (TPR) repeat protein